MLGMRTVKIQIWMIAALLTWAVPGLGADKEERAAISAIRQGDIDALQAYLEKHPGADCAFSNGRTGLYYAIESGQTDVCWFLLERGADPELAVEGRSPLEWSIRHDRQRMARLLIEYGADTGRPDAGGRTPLMYAAELGNLPMCKILVDRGADPLQKDPDGLRAAGYVPPAGAPHVLNYLLSMEARCSGRDTLSSMRDGPYVLFEEDNRVVMTYYEHRPEDHLTRLTEKTIRTLHADTVVTGFGWDSGLYHINREYAPEPCEVATTGEIFAVGDVHGHYSALVNLLENNGIIGPEGRWGFGSGQLVLLGDVFDRGDSVTEVLWFLHELEAEAALAGGRVHLLLGNHEIMAMTGDDRYLNDKYDYFMQYTQISYYQLFDRETELGRWLRSRNSVLTINGYLFTHAGISPQFAIHAFSRQEINDRIRGYLNSDYRIFKNSPEDVILGPIGPFWYRGYGNYDKKYIEVTQDFIDLFLESNGLNRMIIGHNVQPEIMTAYEGKVISADVELEGSGHSAQGLRISGDMVYRCFFYGTRERLE